MSFPEKEHIVFNGKIVEKDNFNISLSNRSFRYGDGVFETVRIMGGKPMFVLEHLERISYALKTFECDNQRKIMDSIKNNLDKIIVKNGIAAGGKLNIIAFRNDGGLYRPYDNNFSYIISTALHLENKYQHVETRNVIGIYGGVTKQIDILSSFKSNNSAIYVLAANWARKNHFDDALILNSNGKITEATSSNIFVLHEKKLITPPLNYGCVDGIMRRKVLHLLDQHSIEYHEGEITEEMLTEADEAFLTNVMNGIKIVTGYKTKRYFKDFGKVLIGMLQEQFED